MFRLTKRRKFIISSLVLSLGLVFVHLDIIPNRYVGIVSLSALAAPLTFWSLQGALVGQLPLVAWIMPVSFTLSIGLFYFLLPVTWLTLIPVFVIYFLGMYALLLSENIFAVASIRTIQLYRSASAVNFLLTLVTAFFLFDTILSFKLSFWSNALLMSVATFWLFLHALWSAQLAEKVTVELWRYAAVASIVIAQLGIALSFWPVTITIGSLFLTAVIYVVLGMAQANVNGRLFKSTIREYLVVGVFVFLILVGYTRWG